MLNKTLRTAKAALATTTLVAVAVIAAPNAAIAAQCIGNMR